MASLENIKLPSDPFYSLKESSLFKFLIDNDYLKINLAKKKTEKLSKETVFQKMIGFFEFISNKNMYSDMFFVQYIAEIHFKHKASLQKQKNYITLLMESMEDWSLESAEIDLIKQLLMIEEKDQKIFGFYLKARKVIVSHCSLAYKKKIFFLDEVELEFSILYA